MKKTFLLLILLLTSIAANALTFNYGRCKYETTGSTNYYSGYPTVKCIGIATGSENETTINVNCIVDYNGTKYHCTEIANNAFMDNTTIKVVRLGYGITRIGARAFKRCTSLIEVKIPSSVNTIAIEAFYGINSSNIVQMAHLSNLPSFGSDCFSTITYLNCPTLDAQKMCQNNATLKNVVRYYQVAPQYAYDWAIAHDSDNTYYYSITKEPMTSTQGEAVLTGLVGSKLELNSSTDVSFNVNYPSKVICKSIAKGAFSQFFEGDRVTSVWIDRTVNIGDSAFYNSPQLTSVYLDLDVGSIGTGAFAKCNISKLTLMSGKIGQQAFSGALNLGTLTIGSSRSSATPVGAYAFEQSALNHVVLNQNVSSIDATAFSGCGMVETIEVDGSNANYAAENNMLYDKNKTTLVYVPAYHSATILRGTDFPQNMTTIAFMAFGGNRKLSHLEVPYGVTYIGVSAFQASNLVSVNLPSSVTFYGELMFLACTNLKYIGVNTKLPSPSSENLLPPKETFQISGDLFKGTVYRRLAHEENSYIQEPIYGMVRYVDRDYYTKTVKCEYGAYDVAYYMNGNINNPLYFSLDNDKKTAMLVPAKFRGDISRPQATTINIPSYIDWRGQRYTVTAIGQGVFQNNTTVTSITIPNTVTEFKGVVGLKFYGDEKDPWEGWQFSGCTNLTTLKLPPTLDKIPFYCFKDTKKLTTIHLPYGVREVAGAGAFAGSGITEILFPSSLRIFRGHELQDATNLKTIILNVDYNKLGKADGNGSFEYKKYTDSDLLTNLYKMPSDLTVYIPVTEFTPSASQNKINMEVLDKWKNDNLFSRYTLKMGAYDVKVKESDGNVAYLNVTQPVQGTGTANAGYAEYTRGPSVLSVMTANVGALLQDSEYTDCYYHADGVGYAAFYNCSSLKQVILTKDLPVIPNLAFSGTAISSYPFSESLTKIGDLAFGRSSLSNNVTVPGKNLTSIGSNAFWGCFLIKSLFIGYHQKIWTTEKPIYGGRMSESFKCYVDYRNFPYSHHAYSGFYSDMSDRSYLELLYPYVQPEADWVTLSFPKLFYSSGKQAEKCTVSLKGIFDKGGKLYAVGDSNTPYSSGAVKVVEIQPQNSQYGARTDKGYLAHLTKGKMYILETYGKEDIDNPQFNCLFPGAIALEQTNWLPSPVTCDADYSASAGVYFMRPTDGESFPTFEKASSLTGKVGEAYLSFQKVTKPYPFPSYIYLVEGGPTVRMGDVNRDGDVNISDVVAIINTMAGDTTFRATADVNSDNNVNISDVVAVINIMAGM